MSDSILFTIIGSLITLIVAILCYFLKEILSEMKAFNVKIATVISNQEWHYKSILELQKKVSVLESRNDRGVEL